MEVLVTEFIGYAKSTWSANSRVDQHRRRLAQLVSKIRAVVSAAEGVVGAAVRDEALSDWLAHLRSEEQRGQDVLDALDRAAAAATSVTGLKALFFCSKEVARLAETVMDLEHLARPGGDVDGVVRLLSLAAATEEGMVIDEHLPDALHWQEESSCSSSSVCEGSSAALLPSPGCKKRNHGDTGVDAAPALPGREKR